MTQKELLARVTAYLAPPPAMRDYSNGATLLYRVNADKRFYRMVMSCPERYADKINTQLEKSRAMLSARLSANKVDMIEEQLRRQIPPVVEKRRAQIAAHQGRREDHDRLPVDALAAYGDGGKLFVMMVAKYSEMLSYTNMGAVVRFPVLQELLAIESAYRACWELYDNAKPLSVDEMHAVLEKVCNAQYTARSDDRMIARDYAALAVDLSKHGEESTYFARAIETRVTRAAYNRIAEAEYCSVSEDAKNKQLLAIENANKLAQKPKPPLRPKETRHRCKLLDGRPDVDAILERGKEIKRCGFHPIELVNERLALTCSTPAEFERKYGLRQSSFAELLRERFEPNDKYCEAMAEELGITSEWVMNLYKAYKSQSIKEESKERNKRKKHYDA